MVSVLLRDCGNLEPVTNGVAKSKLAQRLIGATAGPELLRGLTKAAVVLRWSILWRLS